MISLPAVMMSLARLSVECLVGANYLLGGVRGIDKSLLRFGVVGFQQHPERAGLAGFLRAVLCSYEGVLGFGDLRQAVVKTVENVLDRHGVRALGQGRLPNSLLLAASVAGGWLVTGPGVRDALLLVGLHDVPPCFR